MITDSGTIIRTPVSDIPVYSRTAGGVIVMRLSAGQKLVNFTKVPHEEETEEETAVETAELTEVTVEAVTETEAPEEGE